MASLEIKVTDHDIPVNIQMRTNVPHISVTGDGVGQPILAYKAVHEAHGKCTDLTPQKAQVKSKS